MALPKGWSKNGGLALDAVWVIFLVSKGKEEVHVSNDGRREIDYVILSLSSCRARASGDRQKGK